MNRFDAVLFDLDGTLYLDERLFDGAADFLRAIRSRGGTYRFLTNNSSRGAESYVEKLRRLGVETEISDFLTSVDALIAHLYAQGMAEKLLYVCGTQSMKRQLTQAGLRLTDDRDAAVDALVMGFDTELTFQKLEDACILLNRGADYVATHPDLVCPTWYGSAPDCGSVIEMLHTATGRRPKVIGKPQPEMALLAMERTGYSPRQTCLIGDRVYTDIACGVNAGVDTIFVLSGEGVMEDIEKYGVQPTYCMQNIREVLNTLEKGEPK